MKREEEEQPNCEKNSSQHASVNVDYSISIFIVHVDCYLLELNDQ